MSYSQPPFHATSPASDWPPFLEQAPAFSAHGDPDANNQWLDEALDSLPDDRPIPEEQAMTGFDTNLMFPQQVFIPATNHSMAVPEPYNHAAASASSQLLTDDPAWMFQLNGMAGITDHHQADSLAAPAAFGISAPFGAGQWGPPQMVDQPMRLVPQTGATPFELSLDSFVSTQEAQPGTGSASTPAGAGSNTSEHLMPSFHEKRNGRYHCLFQPCNKSFTREADLFRHQNAYHVQASAYWCSATGCGRGIGGRPFPRKDKRNDHERKVHGGVLSAD